ncbi:hypothetical protein ANN_20366 [Periplaneta americana]|uniref:Uncharacterized protein n=1 Tax=Periplaneta americana TaxID=6978 RepID=A0ABQ8SD59_PERAM|nr:hypothetical protein ANN_20366 [Periplaneta americana]
MSPGSSTESYPAFAHIGLRENTGKTLNQRHRYGVGQARWQELSLHITSPRLTAEGYYVPLTIPCLVAEGGATARCGSREATSAGHGGAAARFHQRGGAEPGQARQSATRIRQGIDTWHPERECRLRIVNVPPRAALVFAAARKKLLSYFTRRLYCVVVRTAFSGPACLREEQRLRVLENNVLRKIFGAKRDEVTGEWRKLHNTDLHALYSSPDIIRNIKSRRLRWAGHVAHMGESRNTYRVLVGRPEGKRPLGRPRRRWEDNIKMDLREVGYDDRDWINLAQDRDQWRAYVRAAMNLRVP